MSKIKDKDNPEWTRAMFRRARPAKDVFPQVDFPQPKRRGQQKSPTKVQTTIRLDRDLIDHFKKKGPGWQTRLNAVLRGAVDKQRKKRA